MLSLFHCPRAIELSPRKRVMGGLSRTRPPSHHHDCRGLRRRCLLTPPIPSSLLGRQRFLSPGSCSSLLSSVMSAKKGHSNTTISKASCEVVWTVEADLAPGQHLYLTGDPFVLGSWQPERAIQMSPSDHGNTWRADVELPYNVNFKYNYFITEETQLLHGIVWRTGPEFSLSVPQRVKQDRKIMVRDSWMKCDCQSFPPHVWGSWIEEAYLSELPLNSVLARDELENVKHVEMDTEELKPFLNDLKVENKSCFNDKEDIAGDRHDRPVSFFSEGDQPVEEPWLLLPSIFLVTKEKMMPQSKNNEHCEVEDKKLPTEDDPISTIILMNSSICTMQRVAVMENGKLVELLLEPVKNNVQCDSVYLGVVTKLVPHMGGAFVNIGGARPSLMEIKKNREPYMFPPFRQMTREKKEVNSSVFDAIEEISVAHTNEHTSDDVEVTNDVAEFISQDDLMPFMHEDHEEHEVDDDYDFLEGKESVNGSVVDYGETAADFEHFLDGREHHRQDESTNSSLHVKTEVANNDLMSHPRDMKDAKPILNNTNKWAQVCRGTKIIVQVVKEGLGSKGPQLTAFPKLRSRFWILITHYDKIGVSKKISGVERTRLKVIAKSLQPPGFGLTVRTVAAGHSLEELQKDLEGLLSTWKCITEHAKSASLAADEGVEGAVPVILHRAMGQTLTVVQDYFNDKVGKLVVDSPRTYHEVTNYLQEIAPALCNRVELYDKKKPLFDEFNVEEEINSILSKRVPLANGGSLVIEQTEALVSIDVNGGHVMFGQGTSQEKATLEVNLAAADQIARELRLRDIGGIIVVDFIDMADESNKRLVYEQMKRSVERDRSMVKVSELSKHGLMEITRKRVRPSVTFMISEPCTCCHATGRVEALETSFSKIEQEICRLLAEVDQTAYLENPKAWPRFILRVDHHMCNYLTSGKKTRLAILSSSLKVWLLLKVARGFTRGAFELKLFTDDKANNKQHQAGISVLQQTEARTVNSGRKVTLVPVKKRKASGK
uniref:Uncharacterized protein MANES_12G064500 n=1 Tax=Rhizophora mucronata TaxID=61149 RepID=A0A2P2LE59_RHIMU